MRSAAPPQTQFGPERAQTSCALVEARLLALGVILVLALGLRIWGVGWQLPWHFHPDEGHYVWKAADMLQDGNLNPKYFRNPSLYTYVLLIELKLLDLFYLSPGAPAMTWEWLQPPSLHTFLGRLTSALLGVGTVGGLYRLGSELLGWPAGLLGAGFLAVCFLHVRDSHFATNDVPATFFLVLSVLFSALLARSRRSVHLLLAALFGGLATSTKYSAGFFLLPLMLAHLTAHRGLGLTPGRMVQLLGASLLSVAAYLVGTPFTVLAWPDFRDDFLVQRRFAREGWEGQDPEPVGWLYVDALGLGLGWMMLGLAALGLILMAHRRPVAAAIIGGYPAAYLAFMLGVKLFFVRFAVPLAPFLCLAAAYGALELTRFVRRRGSLPRRAGSAGVLPVSSLADCGALRVALLAGLVLAATAQPLWSNLQHQRIMSQPDTRVQAYSWLEANLPGGTRIIADDYTIRDRRPREYLPDRARFDLDVVNALSEHELGYYRERGYQYAITSSFQYQRFPGSYQTYAQLELQARRLAVFAPTADSRQLAFDIEDLYSPFHNLPARERPGPTVKIYALLPGATGS